MKTKPQQAADTNRGNQLNPHHPAYYLSRGASPEAAQELASQAGHDSNAASTGGTELQQPGKPSSK